MDRKTLKKKLEKLIADTGPAELLIALHEVMTAQIDDAAPPGGNVEDAVDSVPELKAWSRLLQGPLEKAMRATIKLEDDIGYPPHDQRFTPQNQGRGGILDAIFPWMKK